MHGIVLDEHLEKIEQIDVELPVKCLIDEGNALFFLERRCSHQREILGILRKSLSKDGDLTEDFLGRFTLICQTVQRLAVCFCNIRHEASPTPLMNSEISSS